VQKTFHVRLVCAHLPPNGRRRFARTGGIVPPPTASAAKRGASAKQQNSAGENRESGAKKFKKKFARILFKRLTSKKKYGIISTVFKSGDARIENR